MTRTSSALSSLLGADLIKVGLESLDRDEVFEELIDVLARTGKITDRTAALAAIAEREEQQSTGIGNGVAVPHGKHESVPQLLCCLGISNEGVDFDAIDDQPAHVIFLVLAEVDNPGPHVALLAGISRLLSRPGFTRRLREARSAEEALAAIRATEEEFDEG